MSEQRGNLLVPTNQNLLIVPLTEVSFERGTSYGQPRTQWRTAEGIVLYENE